MRQTGGNGHGDENTRRKTAKRLRKNGLTVTVNGADPEKRSVWTICVGSRGRKQKGPTIGSSSFGDVTGLRLRETADYETFPIQRERRLDRHNRIYNKTLGKLGICGTKPRFSRLHAIPSKLFAKSWRHLSVITREYGRANFTNVKVSVHSEQYTSTVGSQTKRCCLFIDETSVRR